MTLAIYEQQMQIFVVAIKIQNSIKILVKRQAALTKRGNEGSGKPQHINLHYSIH